MVLPGSESVNDGQEFLVMGVIAEVCTVRRLGMKSDQMDSPSEVILDRIGPLYSWMRRVQLWFWSSGAQLTSTGAVVNAFLTELKAVQAFLSEIPGKWISG